MSQLTGKLERLQRSILRDSRNGVRKLYLVSWENVAGGILGERSSSFQQGPIKKMVMETLGEQHALSGEVELPMGFDKWG